MNLDKLTYKTIVLQIKAITLQLKYFNIKPVSYTHLTLPTIA